MSKSQIEWTDEVWNPVTGCTKVSLGCKNCYAEREWPRMTRLVPAYTGRDFTDVRCHPERLEKPLHWTRTRRIFVNSMSDLFHEDVPEEFIVEVFGTMALAQQHTFQVLTKRPVRMRELLSSFDFLMGVRDDVKYEPQAMSMLWPLPNVWLGVSVEDQDAANERIPLLLDTPAAVRWVSAEPLLGRIDIARWLRPRQAPNADGYGGDHAPGWTTDFSALNWVVVGGESGPNARPMSIHWARQLRDQCAAAGVPFLFKQWGEWAPGENVEKRTGTVSSATWFDERWLFGTENLACEDGHCEDQPDLYRVGKKAAGRLLDGVTHDGYPDQRRVS